MLRRGAARFKLRVTAAPEMSGLSHGKLQELVLKLLGKVAELERIIAGQREEIARLKGLKARPPDPPWPRTRTGCSGVCLPAQSAPRRVSGCLI